MPPSRESFDDDELFDLARSAVSGAAVPPDVIAAARAAFHLRSFETELAALIYDSWSDDRLLVGMRAPADASRVLVLRTGEATLELEIVGSRVLGQVDPPVGDRVDLVSADGTVSSVGVDAHGCFSAEANFARLVKVRVFSGGTPALETEWICHDVPGGV